MAVKKTVTFPGGLKAPDCYLIVDRAAFDRVRGRVTYAVVGFVDEATRRAAGAAYARLAAAEAALVAAQAAVATARAAASVQVTDLAAAATLRKNLSAAGAQQVAAQAELDDARTEVQSPAFAPALDAQGQMLPADLAAKVVKADGTLDMSALYGALKQPGQFLEGGADA